MACASMTCFEVYFDVFGHRHHRSIHETRKWYTIENGIMITLRAGALARVLSTADRWLETFWTQWIYAFVVDNSPRDWMVYVRSSTRFFSLQLPPTLESQLQSKWTSGPSWWYVCYGPCFLEAIRHRRSRCRYHCPGLLNPACFNFHRRTLTEFPSRIVREQFMDMASL
jgi:hypothetical protein